MATDFWSSSHYKRWIVDRATLQQARADDLGYVAEPEHLDFLGIYFADLISKLGKKLQLRQRVIATATVFFRRFYLKNSYCETDPYLVLSACCYVAAKAEESPVHIKNVVGESRVIFSQDPYNVKHFPSDNSKLAEMEFYLVDDLECDLVVFHPYRTLLALCKKESSSSNNGTYGHSGTNSPDEAEAGEVGTGIGSEDGPRYWGTGQGKLELSEAALQAAWFIINDTYRTDLCLLYPPHLLAITAIYLTLVLHTNTSNTIAHLLPHSSAFNSGSSDTVSPSSGGSPAQSASTPRRSTRQNESSASSMSATPKKSTQDPIAFLADLNVSLSTISTIAQEIICMYSLWSRYKEDSTKFTLDDVRRSHQTYLETTSRSFHRVSPQAAAPISPAKRSSNGNILASRSSTLASGSSMASPDSLFGDYTSGSPATQPGAADESNVGDGGNSAQRHVGFGSGFITSAQFLSKLILEMREARWGDVSHPPSGRPVVVNRMLERTGGGGGNL